MRRIAWTVAAVPVLLAPGALLAQGQRKTAPDTAAAIGCWDLRLGPWRHRPPEAGPDDVVPRRVQLTATPDSSLVSGGHALVMRAAPGATPSRLRYTNWAPLPGGAVRLSWSGELAGVVAIATLRGDALAGTATTFTDVYPQHPDSAVFRGTRVACNAPLPTDSRRP